VTPLPQLSPFQEKMVRLRLSGLSLEKIAFHTKRRYGTVRLDFHKIYKVLGIHLTCELSQAFMKYEIALGRIHPTVAEVKEELNS
jgi:hypothetical protein